MISQEEAKQLVHKIFTYARAGKTGRTAEVIIYNGSESLTRFANNVITQNVHADEMLSINLRLMHQGKSARASTNQVTDQALKSLVAKAQTLLEAQQKEPVTSLTPPQKYRTLESYNATTASLSPEDRLKAVKQAIDECNQYKFMGSGIYTNSSNLMVLANSTGLLAYHPMTEAEFTLTIIGQDTTGWAGAASHNAQTIDIHSLTSKAIRNAQQGAQPIAIPPGHYTVILEPDATAGLLPFMTMGFGALQYQEGRSFLKGRMGQKIASEQITLSDDAYHPLSPGIPFDFEGMPKQTVALIDKGIVRNLVYDRATAKKDKTQSTGHGLPQPNAIGPIPRNLVLQAGKSSLNEMIASTEKGILVTQFHYTSIVEPMKLLITGLTRNGTFLIEKGRITKGIKNMRFTESVLNALSNVVMVSRELKYAEGMVAPALKIDNFNFSSETGF
jgi:PmbA protein